MKTSYIIAGLVIILCLCLALAVALSLAVAGLVNISLPGVTPISSPGATLVITTSCPDRQPAEPSAAPTIGQETLSSLLSTTIPARNPIEIAARLGRTEGVVPAVVGNEPFAYQVGDREMFWVQDEELSDTYFQIEAQLVYITDHVYWWVEEGQDFDQDDQEALEDAAQEFDSFIYPTVHRYFGEEWKPGVDGDPRIHVLNADLPSVGGYYSSADEYPSAVNPYSNQREMFYMSITNIPPLFPAYLAVLAHEFQHMVHFNVDANDDTWINEGSGDLSSFLNGFDQDTSDFTSDPDIPLMAWTDDIDQAGPYYEGAFLFMSYFTERFGADIVRDFTAQAKDGIAGFDATLAERGIDLDFDQVFKDWLVANYLDDPHLSGGCFGYRDQNVEISEVTSIAELPFSAQETVNQYATDYYELSDIEGDVVIKFDGPESVQVTGADLEDGRLAFWSNRGDVSNMTLTRAFDLSGVSVATLKAEMWWDIELNYDYAYFEVSTDGGHTWEIMDGKYTTAANPYGANYRVGWTAKSGAGEDAEWVEEEIDLTPYVGQEVLLRFEYITDDAFTRPGLLIDEVSIPEIGYTVDFEEGDDGWEAAGFILTDNLLPQRWAVQVIEFRSDGPAIREMTLDAQGKGELTIQSLGDEVEKAVLIISALAPSPNQAAEYEFRVQPAQ